MDWQSGAAADVSENLPLKVTFGLIAYNQEKYIREAIEGAFAQRCASMEIILSDDRSPDGTFAIMEEMAASYSGPHKVYVRREPTNVGTVQHLINIARAARGELLVVAAGDDISYPDRAGTLFDAWKENGAAALASWHDEIDADGRMLRQGVSFPPSEVTQVMFGKEPQAHRVDGLIQTVPGFCAAYPQSFWAELPDPPSRLLVEDGVASALINLRGGRIFRVPVSLIAYRIFEESLTVREGALSFDDILNRERKIDFRAQELVPQAEYTIGQARQEGLNIHPHTLKWLNKGRAHGEVVADFWSKGPIARLLLLAKIRSKYDAKFLLPRLLGIRVFTALRARIKS